MHSSEENKTVSTKLRELGEKMLQDLEQVFPHSPWKREREGKYEGTAARGEKPKIEQVYREGLQPKEWAHPRDGKRVSSRKKV